MDAETVRGRIRKCKRCELSGLCRAPVPFSGPAPARIAVLGEAPGKTEDAVGAPFVGPAGELLRAALYKLGFEPEDMAILNAVSCWPQGTPRGSHIDACESNLWMQLLAIQPAYVLVLGSVALNALRPGAKISIDHGIPWSRRVASGGRRLYFPTYHPAAVLRNDWLGEIWYDDLKEFARLCGLEAPVPRRAPSYRPDIAGDPTIPAAALQRYPRETSEAAKWAVLPRSGSLRRKLLLFIRDRGNKGTTDEETRDELGFTYGSSTERRNELWKGGWVIDSGRTRLTSAGNPAAVWVIDWDWLTDSQGEWLRNQ